jgi:hypothetical protein
MWMEGWIADWMGLVIMQEHSWLLISVPSVSSSHLFVFIPLTEYELRSTNYTTLHLYEHEHEQCIEIAYPSTAWLPAQLRNEATHRQSTQKSYPIATANHTGAHPNQNCTVVDDSAINSRRTSVAATR